MISKQWTLSLLFILLISNQIWAQVPINNYSIKEEVIDLKKGRPVFDESKRIIGRTEVIRNSKNNFIDFENRNLRYKIILNSGKEFEIDELLQNTIYLEKAKRIITYGTQSYGCTMAVASNVLIYDNRGNLLKQIIPFDSSSNSDVLINNKGDTYIVGRYDKDYPNQYLIKYSKNGAIWKKKLPISFGLHDNLKLAISNDNNRIAILQNRTDNIFPTNNISIYDSIGVLIKTYPNRMGGLEEDIYFWDDNKVIMTTKDVSCLFFYDFVSGVNLEYSCFNKTIPPSNQSPLIYVGVNVEEKHILLAKKEKGEIMIIKQLGENQFSILNKIPISKNLISDAISIISNKKSIEIYSLKKKTTIEILN